MIALKNRRQRSGRDLDAGRLLTKIDVPIFCGAAVNYAQWLEAVEEIRRTGTLIKGAKGQPMINPYVRVAREAHLAWQRALIEFGMSASSRTRVKVTKKKDPFEAFLSRAPAPGDDDSPDPVMN
jgi:P27 family predicted phage terminase small subunit